MNATNEELINLGFYSWGVWLRYESRILIHPNGHTCYITNMHVKLRVYPKSIKDIKRLIELTKA